jgi:hypothetical protein
MISLGREGDTGLLVLAQTAAIGESEIDCYKPVAFTLECARDNQEGGWSASFRYR